MDPGVVLRRDLVNRESSIHVLAGLRPLSGQLAEPGKPDLRRSGTRGLADQTRGLVPYYEDTLALTPRVQPQPARPHPARLGIRASWLKSDDKPLRSRGLSSYAPGGVERPTSRFSGVRGRNIPNSGTGRCARCWYQFFHAWYQF